jgi:lipopolysaccharide biosynthesis protein
MHEDVKVIALYFPQLHSIPENDKWWGAGFTDWNNVKSAEPLFAGHHQPRVPLGGHYDQSDIQVIKSQADLAKSYGIYGFCHYHYWFDGKQLLETPTQILLDNKDIDIPFCLSWANETWSRRWDGKDHHILIKQTHPPTKDSWTKHFNYLIVAWLDERAIKIDGKPVFIIYRPHLIEKISEMLSYWNEMAIQRGLKGVYFIFQKQYECPNEESLEGFDAAFDFQPFEAINRQDNRKIIDIRYIARELLNWLPGIMQNFAWSLWSTKIKGAAYYDYNDIWKKIVDGDDNANQKTYHGAFVDWDNTARYKARATIIKGATPERFTYWFTLLIEKVRKDKLKDKVVFINAWNEWSECAYLEPDVDNKFGYLEAIKNVLMTGRRHS